MCHVYGKAYFRLPLLDYSERHPTMWETHCLFGIEKHPVTALGKKASLKYLLDLKELITIDVLEKMATAKQCIALLTP